MTRMIALRDMGTNTILYNITYVQKVEKILITLSRNMNDTKDQNWTSRDENHNVWDEKYIGRN